MITCFVAIRMCDWFVNSDNLRTLHIPLNLLFTTTFILFFTLEHLRILSQYHLSMSSIYIHEPSGLKKLYRSCTLKHGFLVAEKGPLASIVAFPLLAKFILKHTIFLL